MNIDNYIIKNINKKISSHEKIIESLDNEYSLISRAWDKRVELYIDMKISVPYCNIKTHAIQASEVLSCITMHEDKIRKLKTIRTLLSGI